MPAPLIAIIGPTASGKSALAFSLAQHLQGEILAVDSMTVYRHMDIGTAKPPRSEREQIPHHGLDLVEPSDEFSVSRYITHADTVIADCAARGKPLIAVGGTPLYYMSLFKGLFEGPSADEELREKLRAKPNNELHAELTNVDPQAAQRIHANDTKRLIRALEVFHLTGTPISQQQTEWTNNEPRHKALWFGLNWDKDLLNRRINARTKQMIDAGWLDECRSLISHSAIRNPQFASPSPLSKTASEAAGYQELFKHLRGQQSLSDAIEQIKINTRQLARRQTKWFRRFENTTWLAGDAPLEDNLQRVLGKLSP